MKKYQLLICFMLTLVFTGCAQIDGVVSVNKKEALLILEESKAQLVDVRTSSEIEHGKISGALEIDYLKPDFIKKTSSLDKNRPVLVYCKSGGRSQKACEVLKQQGFKNVYNLKGGYMAWVNE